MRSYPGTRFVRAVVVVLLCSMIFGPIALAAQPGTPVVMIARPILFSAPGVLSEILVAEDLGPYR